MDPCFDPKSEAKLAEVHPVLASRIYQLADMLGFPILVTQGYRTWGYQDELWQLGRNPDGSYIDPIHHTGVVTDAKGGHSMHNFALAVDIAPTDGHTVDWNGKDAKWAEILAKAPSCGLSEGAKWRTFPDEPHLYPIECPAEPDDNMRYLMNNGGLQAVWDEFKLA
jgi:peptidoglycan LD-endopeptidase CwlK